jgi:ABC-type glycerol-3-phosphate transport system permease component
MVLGHKLRFRWSSAIIYLFLSALAFSILFPFYWMVVGSTLSLAELNHYPPPLWFGHSLIDNVALVLQRGFLDGAANSLFIAAFRVLGQLVVCSLAGFAFAKYRFPGRDKLFIMMLATLMIPFAVSMIPWYLMMVNFFGWRDSYAALIVPSLANVFAVFWIRQFVTQALPDELLQAARIDGCSEPRLFLSIALPLITPVLGALGLSIFLGSWNDWLGPLLIISSQAKYTLAMLVANVGTAEQANMAITISAMASVPMVVVFFAASRQFISGLTAGALKG